MKLRKLIPPREKAMFVEQFGGLCDEILAKDFEWTDMQNITGDKLPSISTREPYNTIRSLGEYSQLINANQLTWIDEGKVFVKGLEQHSLSKGKKITAQMGNKLIIYPDKVYMDMDSNLIHALEQKNKSIGLVSVSLADEWGIALEIEHSGNTQPENPSNAMIWADTAKKKIKRYNQYAGVFDIVESPFISIKSQGIGKGLKEGDAVTIKGLKNNELNCLHILEFATEDSLSLNAYIGENFDQIQQISVEKLMPDMDFICVWNNRLWGLNNKHRELYASKLGDPSNFSIYTGTSTDSYALSLGSPSDFMGIMSNNEELLIFTQQSIYKLYGTKPGNYRLMASSAPGVKAGCENSIAKVGEFIYYVSGKDVVCYGDRAINIAQRLPDMDWNNAFGFGYNNSYYISDAKGLYSFTKGAWFKQSKYHVNSATLWNNKLYFISANKLMCMSKPDETLINAEYEEEKNMEWYIHTADFSLKLPENRMLSQVQVNMFGKGEYAVFVAYDTAYNETDNNIIPWELVESDFFPKDINIRIPISTRNCHHMRIRIAGFGSATILSLLHMVFD